MSYKIIRLSFLYDSISRLFVVVYRNLQGTKNRDSRESQILFTNKNYLHHDKNLFCTCTKNFSTCTVGSRSVKKCKTSVSC
jgi:hypothetical protein